MAIDKGARPVGIVGNQCIWNRQTHLLGSFQLMCLAYSLFLAHRIVHPEGVQGQPQARNSRVTLRISEAPRADIDHFWVDYKR